MPPDAFPSIDDLAPGDHLCFFYDTPEDHRGTLRSFVGSGIKRNERVVYIADGEHPPDGLGLLGENPEQVDTHLRSGQLCILNAQETYLVGGVFDPDAMIRLLRQETVRAMADGYAALRVTGEMTWALGRPPGSHRLREYESRLSEFFPGSACLALCQYDQRQFSPSMLLDILMVHPLVVVGSELYENPFYSHPSELDQKDRSAAQLRRLLSGLSRQKRTDALLRSTYGEIERRVEERTADLSMSVSLLRQEINQRRRAEEAYRTLVDQTVQGLCILQDGRAAFANRAFAQMGGYTREEMESLSTEQVRSSVHPDDGERVWRHYRDRLTGRQVPERYEFRMIRKDGSVFWVEAHAKLIEYQGRPATQLLFLDITERRRTEEAYRALVDHSLQGLVILQDGRVVFANQAFSDMCGYSQEEMAALSPDQVARTVSEEDRERVRTWYADRQEHRPAPERCEYRMTRKDGSLLWMEVHASPVEYRGRPAIQAAMVDITRRKTAAEALLESEERYRTLVENATDIIYTVDIKTGRITSVNRAVEAILGYAVEEVVGVNIDNYLTERQRELSNAAGRQKLEGMPHTRYEIEVPAKDGHVVPMEINSWLLHEYGQPVAFQGVARDITQRKRAEAERQRLDVKIQQAQKMESLAVLAGGVAHDFNNLLTSVLANASFLLGDVPPDSPMREPLEIIEQSAHQASELTNQMLAYSGRGAFIIERVDLSRLVQDMKHLLKSIVPKGGRLAYDLADDVCAVEADPSQLRQVLMNLVINASEAISGGPGTITVSTGCLEADRSYLDRALLDPGDLPEGAYSYLEISDTGCGMGEDTMAKIFDPFFSKKFTGRGLGLAAVSGIVRGHRGTIAVTSQPGHGSTFRVLLPCSPAPSEDSRGREMPCERCRGADTVLMIGGSADDREDAREILGRMGLDLLTSDEGREGLGIFLEHAETICLVLLDSTLPDRQAEEILLELRGIRPSARIILSVAEGCDITHLGDPWRTVAGFVRKPYQSANLGDLIRFELQRDSQPPE
ncbi:MAG: PAS domain S-box protein [Phycisphaerae bacterium]|nr:PAS domain S-box protein [Phycisphaerae bacterium]